MSRRRSLAPILVLVGVLAVTGAVPADASQGPENGRITFSRYDPALGAHSLWAADPDGQNQQLLAAGPTSFSDWSPSGIHIAFDFANDTGVHIATIDATGGSRQDLTSAPGIQETPKWSPDGQWITYGAFDPQTQDWADFSTSIWVMRSDGSDARRVTHDGFDVEPVFSPDGSQILFGRIMGDSPTGQLEALYVVNTDGTGLREIVPARAGVEHPDWSPDGLWITFNIGPEYPDAVDSGAVLAIHPNGQGQHTLRAPTAHVRYYKAMWSPDGKRLLMGCFDTRVGREQLCTATAGGGRVRIVEDTMDANWPAWGSKPRS
jgi:Tol biopolymer transport system component